MRADLGVRQLVFHFLPAGGDWCSEERKGEYSISSLYRGTMVNLFTKGKGKEKKRKQKKEKKKVLTSGVPRIVLVRVSCGRCEDEVVSGQYLYRFNKNSAAPTRF